MSKEEETCLHHKLLIAVIVGKLDWVKRQIIDEGHNPQLTDEYGATVFHFVDNLEVAEYLYNAILERSGKPPDLNQKDRRGCTPLDYVSTKDPEFGKVFGKFIKEKSQSQSHDQELANELNSALSISEMSDVVDKELSSEISKALNSEIGMKKEVDKVTEFLNKEKSREIEEAES